MEEKEGGKTGVYTHRKPATILLASSVAEPPLFGWLRLRTSEVAEPTSAPGKKSGSGSRQKRAAPSPVTKFF